MNKKGLLAFGLVVFLMLGFSIHNQTKVREAIIIPHHGLVSMWMDEYYADILSKKNIDLVVIIGPNHYGFGQGCIQSGLDWEVDQSNVPIYSQINKEEFLEEGIMVGRNKFFEVEHSLSEQVKSLRRVGYDGEFLPLMLADCAKENEIDDMVSFVFEKIKDENVIIVASIDFTHMDSEEIAQKNDERTIKSIRKWMRGEGMSLKQWQALKSSMSGKVEAVAIDSPESMYAWLKMIDLLGIRVDHKLDVWKNTNSVDLIGIDSDKLMTSHIFAKVVDVVE